MSDFDCIVVGSGPSGLACASALLDAGRRVLMLDAGLQLESARADIVRGAGAVDVATAPWANETEVGAKIPRKRTYGSEFPYERASETLGLRATGMGAEPSFGLGGLSNVWGASALPYAAEDTRDWPVSAEALAPHYAKCAKLLGLAGEADDLAEWLPLYGQPFAQLRASQQAQSMLETLTRNRVRLQGAGMRFGRARVAVDAAACVYCGLCLHGCPKSLIFNAASGVRKLMAHPNFRYQAGVVAARVSETDAWARVEGHALDGAETLSFEAPQIFFATGALATTALLLRSGDRYDTPVRMQDSQYFLLPMVMFSGAKDVQSEALHTMAQLFLEMRDPALSPFTIHMQVYTYNTLMSRAMRARLGSWLEPLAKWGDAHFVLIQGYLHSAHSGAIDLIARRNGDFEAKGAPNPEARRIINALAMKLMRLAPQLGAAPALPLMEIAEPGRGFHIGGSMPMRASPGALETDTLGRPFGWRRIHAVDATVLPSVPATTITYPVMANAHRIGTLAAEGV